MTDAERAVLSAALALHASRREPWRVQVQRLAEYERAAHEYGKQKEAQHG